jgi:hypothetical protein
MNSPTSLPDRSDQRAAEQPSVDAVQHIVAPVAEDTNDRDFYPNPLWMIAGALACLFAFLACFAASG